MSDIVDQCNEIIRRVIHENHGLTGWKLRKKVNQACPYSTKILQEHCEGSKGYEVWTVCVARYLGADAKCPEASEPIPDQWWEKPIKAEGDWNEDREARRS